MKSMKHAMALVIAGSLLGAGPAVAVAAQPAATGPAVPVAGRSTLGVAVVEMDAIVAGWSVKESLMRKAVVNEKKEKIGSVDDIIIAPGADGKMHTSYAIIGVGGFLGIKRHDVAIPMEQLKLVDGKLTLTGATKDALKALPEFEYRRK